METTISARQRNRASTACTQCRKSRIRCVRESDQRQCTQCSTNRTVCVFDDKDGRKSRASSKAFADGLCKRIEQLESLLRQQGTLPANYNQNFEQSNASNSQDGETPGKQDTRNNTLQPEEEPPPYNDQRTDHPQAQDEQRHEEVQPETEPPWTEPAHTRTLVRKLVPCPIRFDMASGRVRFFGPTTSMNIMSETTNASVERHESHWPVALLINDLSPESHDYLLELFWSCHNAVFHLVHKDAFYDDQERGGTQFYSVFLHFCLLATGFRYADKGRQDMQRLAISGTAASTLHVKARHLARLELERPGGIPSIQALFLLGDLECNVGRDDTGWMYAGMSFRLVFDVGLHVDASELRLTEREVQIRHMVLWACLINDKYWSLYLGRPTTLKASDMAPSCLSKDFGRLISCRPSGHEKTPETRVYEALLQLMELVGPLCDLAVKRPTKLTDAYFKIASVDRELNTWYSELPPDLQWNATNIANGPPSLLLLHSQYHTALILLHRPFVRYDSSKPSPQSKEEADSERVNHFTMLSRTVCGDNAKRVASILKRYRERFDVTQVFVTGLQHAGTAATALMAEIVIQSNLIERKELLGQLNCLRITLGLMSKTYQPAVLMSSVVDHFIKDYQRGKESGLSAGEAANGPGTPSAAVFDTQFHSPYGRKRGHQAFDNVGEGFSSSMQESLKKKARFDSSHCFPARSGRGQSPKGLPFLPSSWLEEFDFEDAEFLGLMGAREGTRTPTHLAFGLLSSSTFPGDTDFGLN